MEEGPLSMWVLHQSYFPNGDVVDLEETRGMCSSGWQQIHFLCEEVSREPMTDIPSLYTEDGKKERMSR